MKKRNQNKSGIDFKRSSKYGISICALKGRPIFHNSYDPLYLNAALLT